MIRALVPATAIAALVSVSAFASVDGTAGWQSSAVAIAPPGAFLGGMDRLPNGHLALFDGNAVIEVDPSNGATVGTLYTPPSFVFGSFVKTAPSGAFLVFGESLTQTLTKIPLGGGSPSTITTLNFNFDLAFESDAFAYVSYSDSFGTAQVARVDLATGAADLVLSVPGASGPVALGDDGYLYYGESSTSFPSPRGQQRVVRFSPAQLAFAAGPSNLVAADEEVFAVGLTAPYDMLFDEEGDLLVSDSVDGVVHQFGPFGGSKGPIAAETTPFAAVTNLVFVGNGAAPAQFENFQPASGGTLLALSSDFANFNDLNAITPRRATLKTTPAGPVPLGPYTFSVEKGTPNGLALLLVAAQPLAPEAVVFAAGKPFFFGFQPATLVAQVLVPLDGAGGFALNAVNHGSAGSAVVQGVLLDAQTALVATTEAMTLTLQ